MLIIIGVVIVTVIVMVIAIVIRGLLLETFGYRVEIGWIPIGDILEASIDTFLKLLGNLLGNLLLLNKIK